MDHPQDSDNSFENLGIIVREKNSTSLAKPTKENYADWLKDSLAGDAPDIYLALKKATLLSLAPRKDKETGELLPPPQKAMEFAAEVLGLRSQDGTVNISTTINSNSGNTNITNGASMENIVRMMDQRDASKKDADIIRESPLDAEFEDIPKDKQQG